MKKSYVAIALLGLMSVTWHMPASAATGPRSECRTHRVGTILNVPQIKVRWVTRRWPIRTRWPKVMKRTKKIGLHVKTCNPKGTARSVIVRAKREVKKCFKLGMKAGGAALLASGTKALPTFFATFKGCLVMKLKQVKRLVKVKSFTKSTYSSWRGL